MLHFAARDWLLLEGDQPPTLLPPLQALGVEATAVNQAFREQVLAASSERHSLGQACPSELAGHANAGYK